MFISPLKKLFLYLSPVYTYKISGHSMLPTVKEGSTVLVNRLAYLFKQPQKDDIVAIRKPTSREVLIKRISRVEGQKVFVLGDNKEDSIDSRKFGMLEKRYIIGKIVYYA